MKNSPNNQIVIYCAPDGRASLDVRLEKETIWLTQKQMGTLFDCSTDNISLHLKNIFRSKELEENSVTENSSVTAEDGKCYQVKHYNLDAIISVGYRVNSIRGTQFRIWATKTLRDHLVKGFTVNPNRLAQIPVTRVKEFEQAIALLDSAREKMLSGDEAKGLLEVITSYAKTWLTLQNYDEDKLESKGTSRKFVYELNHVDAVHAIAELKKNLLRKKEASELFGCERGDGLKSILGNLNQTFGGRELYPTIEEKAAHLLYFVIKDHPLADGNKRTGALLFILYLSRNRYLVNKKGEKKFNDNALVALALLVAESRPADKELLIGLIINLLKEKK